MSGGIFDYAQQHILNIKEEIINEGKILRKLINNLRTL